MGQGKARRFGFITTNSISQSVEAHLSDKTNPIAILFAVHDHPWIDPHSGADVRDGANVRVAMTVGRSQYDGGVVRFATVVDVEPTASTGDVSTKLELLEVDAIASDLRPRRSEEPVSPLWANGDICFQGVVPAGDGFKLNDKNPSDHDLRHKAPFGIVRPYIIGRDITGEIEPKFIIDLFGVDEESFRRMPEIYQRLLDTVYPFRKENARKVYREKWWVFAEPRPALRKAVRNLRRFIVTPYTAKFRPFVFVDALVVPDAMAYAIALEDGYDLGILSSAPHALWCLRVGGTLENRPRYNSKDCFEPFPFPASTDYQKEAIRDIAERLDAHRKCQQQLHSSLTLTEMYNVLEKLRAGEEFTEQDHHIYDAGLIGSLRELHDSLDRAVFDAYGWPHDLTTDQILERVVALNAARRAEEASGLIRWLRPEYQAPNYVPVTATLGGFLDEVPAAARRKQPWPAAIPDQFRVIKDAMRAAAPQTPQQIAAAFRPAPRTRISEILATLAALGQARESAGRYSL